ncbi:MAG: hypothetical protein OXC41_09025 [Gammaproteobacteria bacterium]|nr:hypothetical protein [Gammaproteobacteria bacterium]
MAEKHPARSHEDKARVEFRTPLDRDALLEFCQDVERLFRINPYLVFERWEKISARQYHMHAINHSQTPAFEIDTGMTVQPAPDGFEIHYADGLKSSTRFLVGALPQGSRLVIEEEYKGVPEPERLERLHEVDRSLTKWAEELQHYLVQWQRWAWFSPWRYYKQRIWQSMKPAARRITFVLLCITAIEIALIGLGVVIYLIEYRG